MGRENNTKDSLLKKADNKIQDIEKKYLDDRSDLSKDQKRRIDERREKYFGKMNSDDKNKMSEKLLGSYGVQIFKTYLPYVHNDYTPIYNIDKGFRLKNRVINFDITRWVIDPEEKNIEKLISVYEVLSNEKCSIALIYDRKTEGTTVTLSISNLGETDTPDRINKFAKRIISAIYGNFPGAIVNEDFHTGEPECLKKSIAYEKESNNDENDDIKIGHCDSVAVVTNIPSDKSDDFISQSIEKLLDGIIPSKEGEEYKLVLLAQPNKDTIEQKNSLCEIHSALSPFASWQTSISASEADSESMASTLGKHIGGSVGVSESVQAGVPGVGGISAGVNASANFGVNFGKTANQSISLTKGESVTETYSNYAVKHALELLEEQIKRIEECSALGMWRFAAYSISPDVNVANNVASMYLALTQGEKSHLLQPAINLWNGSGNADEAACIIESIKRLNHPSFILKEEKVDVNENSLLLPTETDLCSLVSGKELARSLNFPRKSVAGFPVIECASFARNVVTYDSKSDHKKIQLGQIYHMNKEEPTKVNLATKSLASHTFITGSTGSGKSNTIYHILEEIKSQGVKFLVVEPAKGEYKGVFGSDNSVSVYSTNPAISELLRLNPFSFSNEIHILEHLDKLVEIFNACWPMYAAMPAVLKSAIEQSYIDCGWNTLTSENYYNEMVFPTFADVARNIKTIIDSSDYDNENKGAYKGSLLTRLTSLTNGINGVIFSCDEIEPQKLFDENVIIDLSRVGSSETKSLIMGILVLKLHEYRMSKAYTDNEELKHITVLEEAHNILRRTSFEQSADGANLQGKSVEMIANAIAEMRTYGEGFIIADQAPGFMDMSVIRNTNTKIIMRLPDQSDRELVGKSANLNDSQIAELSKLRCGVAAVYQNEWIQPVLCKIPKSEKEFKKYEYFCDKTELNEKQKDASVVDALMDIDNLKYGEKENLIKLKYAVLRSGMSSETKRTFLDYIISDEKESLKSLRKLAYEFFSAAIAIEKSRDCSDVESWVKSVVEKLEPSITAYSAEQINLLVSLIVYEQTIRNRDYDDLLCRYAEVFKTEGGVY